MGGLGGKAWGACSEEFKGCVLWDVRCLRGCWVGCGGYSRCTICLKLAKNCFFTGFSMLLIVNVLS